MKVRLMSAEREFASSPEPVGDADALMQDLELDTLFDAMADGDDFLRDVARRALLCATGNDAETIRYRQDALRDCIAHEALIHQLYALSIEPIERQRRIYTWMGSRYPGSALGSAVRLLQALLPVLKALVSFARQHAEQFHSTAFRQFFRRVKNQLDDDALQRAEQQLAALTFPHGLLASVGLDAANRGQRYTLHELHHDAHGWLTGLLGKHASDSIHFRIDTRDEAGLQALSELRDRALADVANMMLQIAQHVLDFFTGLRTELAFYLGGLKLRAALQAKDVTLCFPEISPPAARCLHGKGLADPGLALLLDHPVTCNDIEADDKRLVLISGANQGGKSTFLRSLGVAQLMMQAGLFVTASAFAASRCDGLFTHYRREEDTSLNSGKFDEELKRMNQIVEQLGDAPVILFNESFAATNEREGSEIARQIVTSLTEHGVRVVFVSHMYTLARRFAEQQPENTLFLRAERLDDGKRSFKLHPAPPDQSSHGIDLYRQVFGDENAGASS